MASDIAFFATKSISLNICGGRKPQMLMDAARHNLREIQAERGADGHIDASRIEENVLLAGPGTAEGVQALAVKWLAESGIDTSKMRRDHCQAIEVVFSLHAKSSIDPVAYFRRCLAWVGAEMRLPVLSAVVHQDEATPHCHALLLPVRDGKHVGSYPIDKKALRGMRDSFFNKVAGPSGLRRMGAKMTGTVKRMAVAAVLRTCEEQGMPEKVSVLWPIFRAAIERDPTEAVKALNLSDEEIRAEKTGAPNPIGFAGDDIHAAPNPTGIEKHPQKTEPYPCVGFAQQTTSSAPAEQAVGEAAASGGGIQNRGSGDNRKRIETLEELWAAVGCRSVWKGRKKPERETAASGMVAKTVAAAEPGCKSVPVTVEPVSVEKDDGNGVVRVRDEFADDLSAWGDY
ncbi:MAG: plasmid recombination protein [Hydrogenophaga sp.]|jgi:hypothetical protein|nr:plasmid recombination protein [Hydrogenophaga sp.]